MGATEMPLTAFRSGDVRKRSPADIIEYRQWNVLLIAAVGPKADFAVSPKAD
jgi:hypothetical protein